MAPNTSTGNLYWSQMICLGDIESIIISCLGDICREYYNYALSNNLMMTFLPDQETN